MLWIISCFGAVLITSLGFYKAYRLIMSDLESDDYVQRLERHNMILTDLVEILARDRK